MVTLAGYPSLRKLLLSMPYFSSVQVLFSTRKVETDMALRRRYRLCDKSYDYKWCSEMRILSSAFMGFNAMVHVRMASEALSLYTLTTADYNIREFGNLTGF